MGKIKMKTMKLLLSIFLMFVFAIATMNAQEAQKETSFIQTAEAAKEQLQAKESLMDDDDDDDDDDEDDDEEDDDDDDDDDDDEDDDDEDDDDDDDDDDD